MKRYLAALLVLCSCAGWQKVAWEAVDNTQKASEALAKSAVPVIYASCQHELEACKKRDGIVNALEVDCPNYEFCMLVLEEVLYRFEQIQRACIAAEAALRIGDSDSASAAIAESARLLKELYAALKEAGVVP